MIITGLKGELVLSVYEVDEILFLMRRWCPEGDITVTNLKQKTNIPDILVEKAVHELERIHAISISEDGKISINGNSFYESYGWYMTYNLKLLEKSLSKFIKANPDDAGIIKAKLLSLPAPCIIKRRLVVLFLMFFKDDKNEYVQNKILEIKSSIEKHETWRMAPSFFQEWLESEIKIFIYFSRMAILNYPIGIVWESDILSLFENMGCRKEDIQGKLKYLCFIETLSEYLNGTLIVWEAESGIWDKINKIPSIQLPECKMP